MKLTEKNVAQLVRQYLKEFIVPVIKGTMFSLNDISGLVYRETFSKLIPLLRKGQTIEQIFTNFTGDGGHGHSPFQIDDRYHQSFIRSGDWKDLHKASAKCMEVLKSFESELKQYKNRPDFKKMVFSAYNCGGSNVRKALARGFDSDRYTWQSNYGAEVIRLSKVLDSIPDDEPDQAESVKGHDNKTTINPNKAKRTN